MSLSSLRYIVRVAFSSYPWRYNKIVFTPEDFHKTWVYPLKNMGLPTEEYGSTPQEYGSIAEKYGSTPQEYGSTHEKFHEN